RRPFDYMLNALRLVGGFSLTEFEARTGVSRNDIAGELDTASRRDWIASSGDHVIPTELGRRFTNDVIALFLKD
ncbi:MAG: radical superfamily protein, partial [Xanthomonadaceae bacterium]|nr:radical superfamily protein [Xanthomonadaceae bacterium]